MDAGIEGVAVGIVDPDCSMDGDFVVVGGHYSAAGSQMG